MTLQHRPLHEMAVLVMGTGNHTYYLHVYARQRPGGVAWDAVPLTVCGLNKAAGNPPFLFTVYFCLGFRSEVKEACRHLRN